MTLSLSLSKSSHLPWLCMQLLTCYYSLTDLLGPAASSILRKWWAAYIKARDTLKPALTKVNMTLTTLLSKTPAHHSLPRCSSLPYLCLYLNTATSVAPTCTEPASQTLSSCCLLQSYSITLFVIHNISFHFLVNDLYSKHLGGNSSIQITSYCQWDSPCMLSYCTWYNKGFLWFLWFYSNTAAI